MRRLAKSSDNSQAIAALERIVQVEDRPALVEKADLELAQRSVKACQEKLTPLGAELSMIAQPLDFVRVVPLLNVTLGEKWQGTDEDLKCIAQLRRQYYYRLEGEAIGDQIVNLIAEKEKVEFLQLWYTKVTPAAVDSLKAKHPNAMVYVRGDALLGVKAKQEPNPSGVVVESVQPGSGAFNAGIVAGDIIATLGGHSLPDFDRLTAHIAQHRPGTIVPVEVIRGGERMKLDVTLGSWPGQEP
jgi:membrane-associated protease RseP (regulator of RpoE activity)